MVNDSGSMDVLLAGESWVTNEVHAKGFDQFVNWGYHLGAGHLVQALAGSQFNLTYMPSHLALRDFPLQLDELQRYQAVILSDIGSNTLLLHPDAYVHGKPTPNRLKLIRSYVEAGGGLIMMGGYYSFQGINGAARYHGSPVEDVLPVKIQPWDDRIEVPEGFAPQVAAGGVGHPILDGISNDWPLLLGLNEVECKQGSGVELLLEAPTDRGNRPLLVVGRYGAGRSLAWMSDIGPHWLPDTFAAWPGYSRLWRQALRWVTGAE